MTNDLMIYYFFFFILVVNSLLAVVLPLFGLFRWKGAWKVLVLFPYAILAMTGGVMYARIQNDAQAHTLWPIELFLWALGSWFFVVGVDWLHIRQTKGWKQ